MEEFNWGKPKTSAENLVPEIQDVLNDTGKPCEVNKLPMQEENVNHPRPSEGELSPTSSTENSPTNVERLEESTMTAADLQYHEQSSIEPSRSSSYKSSDVEKSVTVTVDESHDTIESASATVSNDVATWKKLSSKERDALAVMAPQPIPKDLPKDTKNRSFPMSIFSKRMPNGETVERDWLVWSETGKCLYCFCCCLFSTKPPSSAFSEFSHPQLGCKDNWRKLYEKTQTHERSQMHISNYMIWRDFLVSAENKRGIDALQQQALSAEKERWRQILRCLLEVTLFLAERNLPFRGSSSTVGDLDNGLFLGTLELVSSYNPTIKEHLDTVKKYQERGERMQAHYLSWQSQNEFLSLCAKKIMNKIISEIEQSYYYGLIVDGTPDVSHTEQLTFVLRYAVLKNGNWEVVERFLTIKDFEKKKGEDICQVIFSILKEHKINIDRCRGQGYDNASNMSGCYKGVQALFLEKNPQAFYAPCSAHSLNLCGVHAVEVAPEIKLFFGNVQKLYNLFSASPARWKILKDTTGVSLHSLSKTRWSARIDAVRPLVKNHKKMLEALSKLQTELDLTAEAYSDSECLLMWMNSFEYILMATFWFKTLQCIDDVNKILQFADISIAEEAKYLGSLHQDVQTLRDSWENLLEEAKLVSSALDQTTTLQEKRSRKTTRRNPNEAEEHVHSTQEEAFKVNVFYKALDTLLLQLSERFKAVEELADMFEFIVNPPVNPSNEIVKEQAKRLAESYPNDVIEEDLEEELRHYAKFFQDLGVKAVAKKNKAIALLNYIFEKKIESLYPQICICLRIFLSIPVSVASGERSFSKLALIKSRLRSTMTQERIANLMVLSIEHRLARCLNFEDLIDSFAAEKARKKIF